jgi:hypothetical protein
MYTRLKDIPVFEFRDTQLDAGHFNHVQVALKKLGDSIRFPIPKLKHLDLILEKEAWIIVDHVLNDIPVAAWTDFQAEHRDNLHQPIKCRLQLYHANADLILARTLDAMELLLGEQLAELAPDTSDASASVLPFRERST